MTTVPVGSPAAIDPRASALVACVILGFFAFFVLRGEGLEPLVFADEWLHSVSARLLPLSDVFSPSYLYYFLYRPTAACGSAFLDCARLMNIAAFSAAGLMFFFYALRYVTTGFAVGLLLVFLGSPSNVYVLLFSPDALFYATFVVFFTALLLLDNSARAIISGVLLGLLALIKINAIFLIPGVLLFFMLEHWIIRRRFVPFFVNSVLLVVSFAASKVAIGYLLAGRHGLSITGEQYAGIASLTLDLPTVTGRLPLIAFSIGGFVAAALLLLGTPLLSLFLVKPRSGLHAAALDRTLGFAAVCVLLPLLGIMGMFTALVSGSGPYEWAQRLSLRHSSFIFPFLYLFAVSVLTKLEVATALSARTKILSSITAVATVAMVFVISNYFLPIISESPELTFVNHSRSSLVIGSALLLLPLVLMFFRPALAARGYVASLLLLSLVWTFVSKQELRPLRTPTPFDAAGRYAALFLGPERANVAVLGTEPAGLFRAMFHLDAVGPIGVQLTVGTARESLLQQLQSRKWVLLIGPDALKLAPPNTLAPTGFALVPYEALAR